MRVGPDTLGLLLPADALVVDALEKAKDKLANTLRAVDAPRLRLRASDTAEPYEPDIEVGRLGPVHNSAARAAVVTWTGAGGEDRRARHRR
jgi:hypothetical protein